ncbi:MAG TPA: sialidase family protein [Symbiobacteriaceae bacterium]|nr:sialidase family protein [Symbiobacteriaceae bacterium]
MSSRSPRLVAAMCALTLLLVAGCTPNNLADWMARQLVEGGQAAAINPPAEPVLVSGPSPYAGCTLPGAGVRYPNADVETWLAVNPAALKQGKVEYIGVWMTDRWSNGGGSGLVAASSFDAGRTWTQTPLAFGGCSENGLRSWPRVSDPWVTFGPDGKAYMSGLIADVTRGYFAMAAATSSDGGRTWGDHQVVAEATRGGQVMLDKESVTADPTRPGTAYMVWNRNNYGETPYFSSVQFSMTTDGGKTWSQPENIFRPDQGQVPVGNVIVVDPRDGTLYNLFHWSSPKAPDSEERVAQIGFMRSTDGGRNWSAARRIIDVTNGKVMTPDGRVEVRTGGPLPLTAIDPRTGRIYVVWGDQRFEGGQPAIAIAYSDDRGDTWSDPVRVNPPSSRGAFRGTVAVNSRGQVGVSYYDFRETETPGEGVPTHLWLAIYTPSEQGLGEPKETHITGPFDLSAAPLANGYFLGDYLGLVAVGDGFTLFYVATVSKANPTDVYAVTVRPLQN